MVFPVKWTQFYLEEKGMHAIHSFNHLWITLQRGAVWEIFLQGKTPDFYTFFCLGRYLHVLKSPSLCPYMLQADYSLNSQVAAASSL